VSETAVFITERAAETGCSRIITAMRLTGAEVSIRKLYRRGELRGYTATITHGVMKMLVTEGILDDARQVA
jgi:hypothetical protein